MINQVREFVKNILCISVYPLTPFNNKLLLNFPRNERFIFDSNGSQISRNTIAYIQNQSDSKRMCLNQCETSFNIRPVLQKLICSTETELNSDEFVYYINKVNIIDSLYENVHLTCGNIAIEFF